MASIVWGATVLAGCSSQVNEPIPYPIETNVWPETVTDSEVSTISNLSTATLNDSLNSMDRIIDILNNHSGEEGLNKYKSTIEMVKRTISSGSLSRFTASEIANVVQRTFDLNDFRDNNDDGRYDSDSYSEYVSAHTAAENAVNTYNSEWTSYDSARTTYKNAVSGISQPKYDAVVNFAKSVVDDFKDNYIFNNTYDENTVKNMVNEAIAEKNTVSASVAPEYNTYSAAYTNLRNAEDNAIDAVNTYNTFEIRLSNGGSEIHGGNGTQETSVTITLGNSDLSVINENTTSVTIAVPSGATDIDVLALAKLKRDVEDKFDDLYMDKSNISFADYPDSVNTFTLNMAGSAAATLLSDANITGVKDNIALMKYLAPANEFEYTNPTPGASAEGVVEVIPGVKIKSFVDSYPSDGRKPGNNGLYRAFDFSGNNKTVNVEIPSEYDLTGTYKAGIIGNVNLTNLALKTISGEVLGKSGIDNLYNTFVYGKGGNLATLNLGYDPVSSEIQEFYSIGKISTNMYDTKLDAIITYYVDNAIGKFSTTMSNVVFDAKSTLNGGTMYNGDTYQGSGLGSVDINTVLLTNASLSNIKVGGVKEVSANTISTNMANVYFDTVMSEVSITGGTKGVIEFTKAAPARISGDNGSKIIFNKVSSNILMTGPRVLDISSSNVDVSKIKYAGSGSKTIGTVIGNNGNVPSEFIKGASDSRTSQQFEQAANQPWE